MDSMHMIDDDDLQASARSHGNYQLYSRPTSLSLQVGPHGPIDLSLGQDPNSGQTSSDELALDLSMARPADDSSSELSDLDGPHAINGTIIDPLFDPNTSNPILSEPAMREETADPLAIEHIESWPIIPKQRRKNCMVSELIYPKSCYNGFQPPFPPTTESHAIRDLELILEQRKRLTPNLVKAGTPDSSSSNSDEEFIEFELSDFSVYLDKEVKLHPLKMRGLQHQFSKAGNANFLFDGILSVGNVRRYVQGIPFLEAPIGNYGKDLHTVGENVWIRSKYNSRTNIYYRLGDPAPEYERFHTGFLWLADLAKHFVDFCRDCGPNQVTSTRFRQEFAQWLWEQHGESKEFQDWFRAYDSRNFLPTIAVNIDFLWKESCGMDEMLGTHDLRHQPIFSELKALDAVPRQPMREDKTIVTPYVHGVFKPLNFGPFLKCVEPIGTSHFQQSLQIEALHLTHRNPSTAHVVAVPQKLRAIRVGDVLSVTKDGAGVGSVWKDEQSKHRAIEKCWYVYVLAVHQEEGEEPEFDVKWLYKPCDTSCAKMNYPYGNELFMSDHCNCTRKDERILKDEVINIEQVLWNSGPPKDSSKLFIRQTWLEQEKFVTLQESHKYCQHHPKTPSIKRQTEVSEFRIGQTVLVEPPRKSKHALEVYEIADYISKKPHSKVVLRRLLRRKDYDGTGRPNELIYTEQTDTVQTSKLERTCLVRFYTEGDVLSKNIPAPYCRDGNGNAFFISSRLVEKHGHVVLEPIMDDPPEGLIQGFNPLDAPSRKLLRGMDLYCGGGNFGRGLEEGGAVHNEWAVDLYDAAIHTYRANLKDPGATKMFYGSVNDVLAQALNGNPRNSELIPAPGEVDFISAGSPCQGFSGLNSNKDNTKGLFNQSLVASVAAYIDFYRPKYGLLENVLNMAQKGRRRDEDVLSQLICAIVGMGYQLQVFVLDAWSCGSPQSRSRIFVSFAAPGLVPLVHPELSHSHPPNKKDRGLGQLSNGEAFGTRKVGPTPFEFVTIGRASDFLPVIGDGQIYHCTKYPYHILVCGVTAPQKQQIDIIPTRPRGMNFAKTWNGGKGVMTEQERKLFPDHIANSGRPRQAMQHNSNAWGRINPGGLMPTVTVSVSIECSRMGTHLHWDQHRPMTAAEAKLAQGFPDGEILVGIPTAWYKILGNSVCRSVSTALGLSLREAWLKNASDEELEKDMAASVELSNFKPLPSKISPKVSTSSDDELAMSKSFPVNLGPRSAEPSKAGPELKGSPQRRSSTEKPSKRVGPAVVTPSPNMSPPLGFSFSPTRDAPPSLEQSYELANVTRVLQPPRSSPQAPPQISPKLTSSSTITTASGKVEDVYDVPSDTDDELAQVTTPIGRSNKGKEVPSSLRRRQTAHSHLGVWNFGTLRGLPSRPAEGLPHPPSRPTSRQESTSRASGQRIVPTAEVVTDALKKRKMPSGVPAPSNSKFRRMDGQIRVSSSSPRPGKLENQCSDTDIVRSTLRETLHSEDFTEKSNSTTQQTSVPLFTSVYNNNRNQIVIPDSEEDEISDSLISFELTEQHRRFQCRAVTTTATRRSETSSRPLVLPTREPLGSRSSLKSKPSSYKPSVEGRIKVIDLCSSDEEVEHKPFDKKKFTSQSQKCVSQSQAGRYVPVDNSSFSAYRQTNRVLDKVRATQQNFKKRG